MQPIPIPGFSDPVASISHLLAACVFVVLSYWLVKKGLTRKGRFLTLAQFAFACVFLLSVSGVYHSLTPGTTARAVMQRMDHAAIFTLIAASATAPHMILFRGIWRWGMVALLWSIAITGLTLKTIYFNDLPEWIGVGLYLGMGWLGILTVGKLWQHHRPLVGLLIAGGLAYTVGALCELAEWPILIDGVFGPHELFHLAVIAGVALHWRFVLAFADGRRRPVFAHAKGVAIYALEEHHVDELVRLRPSRSRADVDRALRHSLVAGLLNEEGGLIACARMLSDRAFEAVIVDVLIDEELRSDELADQLMEAILAHPELRETQRVGLLCPDELRDVYSERWEFKPEARDASVLWRESQA
ncbi:MAG: hemolysin III family protein [Planctomycetes bacterium]|nr:hemolysin III family protein [Planctomycetota bacterium]